ncbi:MAG: ketol-acid reductoisomerase, partial [Dehalococcoidales bacterium]
ERAADVYTSELASTVRAGQTVGFVHGFNIRYGYIEPPDDVDVIMVAPKGSGLNVRRNFLNGAGINSSFAVFQDATGRARERCLAVGIAIGSGYLFPTTFEKEVMSDLVGERGVLMGALAGIMEAQYDTLRKHGHSPSEAFNETVEELTESLIRLVGENGMDWMYANCSTTAQRGALDWKPKFKKAVMPVFNDLYERVADGRETRRVIRTCSRPDYKQKLQEELAAMGESEMWATGKAARSLRPKEPEKADLAIAKGTAGRQEN